MAQELGPLAVKEGNDVAKRISSDAPGIVVALNEDASGGARLPATLPVPDERP